MCKICPRLLHISPTYVAHLAQLITFHSGPLCHWSHKAWETHTICIYNLSCSKHTPCPGNSVYQAGTCIPLACLVLNYIKPVHRHVPHIWSNKYHGGHGGGQNNELSIHIIHHTRISPLILCASQPLTK